MLTWITALNQQVLPTFFRPTGQLSTRFLSCGLGESLHTSVWVRFRLALFSAMLASKTLKIRGSQNTNPFYGKATITFLFGPNEANISLPLPDLSLQDYRIYVQPHFLFAIFKLLSSHALSCAKNKPVLPT